jgi:hypothetical protein
MESSNRPCLNCGTVVNDLYCPHCGQETATEKFNTGYLGKKLLDAFDLDRGLFHSLLNLLWRPGTAIRKYVDGHRRELVNPVKLFLILGAIATVLTTIWESSMHDTPPAALGFELYDYPNFYHYAAKYFSFFNLTAIPLFSAFSWILFKKTGFNFIENLVLNLYIGAGQFLILILFKALPVALFSDTFNFVYGSLNFLYNVWALVFFFRAFSAIGFIRAFVAVAIPQVGGFLFSYLVYRSVPSQFWQLLDRVMN